MIEVEQKFQLKPGDRERLLAGAEFVNTHVMHDVYYDTADAKLISGEAFLRNRDGRFELKLPLHRLSKQLPKAYHYQEYEDEAEIRKVLNLPAAGTMAEVLERSGYKAVAEYATTRTKYRREPFILDFDTTDFGFSVIEIERQVEREEERADAAQSIHDFANEVGLELVHVRGRIHEFLVLKRPDLWEQVKAEWAKWPER